MWTLDKSTVHTHLEPDADTSQSTSLNVTVVFVLMLAVIVVSSARANDVASGLQLLRHTREVLPSSKVLVSRVRSTAPPPLPKLHKHISTSCTS